MPDADTYLTIREAVTGHVRDRGSKFIGYACPVSTEEEIKSWMTLLRKRHHDAHHHCYAWALGPERSPYRVNDDGEPSGSAGKPIYGQILSNNLSDILVVVVRYFGGTKLGIPGLIQAYRGAAMEALAKADRVIKTITFPVEVRFPYDRLNDVMHIIKEEHLTLKDPDFDTICHITLIIRKKQVQHILEKLNDLPGVVITHSLPS